MVDKKADRLDEALKNALEQGETVHWKGEPAKVNLLAAPQGMMIIIRWAVCLIILLLVLWYAVVYGSASGTSGNVTVVVVIVVLAVLYVALRPILDVRSIQNGVAYCITNKRAFVCLLATQTKIKSAYFADISEFDIDELAPGFGNVYVGKKAPESLRRSRGDTLSYSSDPPDRPLVFYNVENPEKVVSFFR